jgi:hypothetical protein
MVLGVVCMENLFVFVSVSCGVSAVDSSGVLSEPSPVLSFIVSHNGR